ncbi:MAG: hypothetical protein JW818_19545 [Pirellulales bacterium]|nr:hypothetical protein [Pirellulales bacterium]
MRQFLFTAVLGSLVLLPSLAAGQWPANTRRPYTPYQPSRPTLSPWFGLYNTNRGPLPNYQNYVVPRQQLERTLQQQETALRMQEAQYRSLQQNLNRRFDQAAEARPTGSNSGFMTYGNRFQNQRTFFRTR